MTYRLLSASMAFATMFVVHAVTPAAAQNLTYLKTPPASLDKLTPAEMNGFGLEAAKEAYGLLAGAGQGGAQGRKDRKFAQALLDDKVLVQTASLNYGLTKKTYPFAPIESFSVTDVVLPRAAPDVLAATYKVSLPDRIDRKTGAVMSGQSLPRLTVLRWNPKKALWQIVSHADYDSVEGTLCGFKPAPLPPRSRFKASDVALGKTIMNEMIDTMLAGDHRNLYTPGHQVMFASGERSAGTPITTLKRRVQPVNLEAIRSDRIIAIRYDIDNALQVNHGALASPSNPRLMTYYFNDKNEWRLVGSAVLAVSAKTATDAKCIEPTKKN